MKKVKRGTAKVLHETGVTEISEDFLPSDLRDNEEHEVFDAASEVQPDGSDGWAEPSEPPAGTPLTPAELGAVEPKRRGRKPGQVVRPRRPAGAREYDRIQKQLENLERIKADVKAKLLGKACHELLKVADFMGLHELDADGEEHLRALIRNLRQPVVRVEHQSIAPEMSVVTNGAACLETAAEP